MREVAVSEVGEGRTRVRMRVFAQGTDLLVIVDGEGAHIGAATLAEPACASVTPAGAPPRAPAKPRGRDRSARAGWRGTVVAPPHKEAEISRAVASAVAGATGKRTLCAAGIHVDHIAHQEIREIRANVRRALESAIAGLGGLD